MYRGSWICSTTLMFSILNYNVYAYGPDLADINCNPLHHTKILALLTLIHYRAMSGITMHTNAIFCVECQSHDFGVPDTLSFSHLWSQAEREARHQDCNCRLQLEKCQSLRRSVILWCRLAWISNFLLLTPQWRSDSNIEIKLPVIISMQYCSTFPVHYVNFDVL